MADKIYNESTKASEQLGFLIQTVTQSMIESLKNVSNDATKYREVSSTLAVFLSSFTGLAEQRRTIDEVDKLYKDVLEIANHKEHNKTLNTVRQVYRLANECGIFCDYSMSMNYELYLKQKELQLKRH